MKRLEEIVQSLEGGEMPLGNPWKCLRKACSWPAIVPANFETAEKKVSLLVQESDGKYKETPFRPGGENNGNQSEF
jgi:exonuclease VII small subunit